MRISCPVPKKCSSCYAHSTESDTLIDLPWGKQRSYQDIIDGLTHYWS